MLLNTRVCGERRRRGVCPRSVRPWARTTFELEPPASGPGPLRDPPRGSKEPPAYTSPILKPAAAAIVKQRYESVQAGKPYPTPSETCWPMVPPLIFRVREMELVQKKDEVLLLYMQDHEVRQVRIGGTHLANLTPTWHGDSIGHYEGDTLVVDTIADYREVTNAQNVVQSGHVRVPGRPRWRKALQENPWFKIYRVPSARAVNDQPLWQ